MTGQVAIGHLPLLGNFGTITVHASAAGAGRPVPQPAHAGSKPMSIPRRLRSERGSVAISGLLVALALIVLIGTGVDIAHAFIVRRDLTAIADDAALVGSQQLDVQAWRQGQLTLNDPQAEQAAENELAANPGIAGSAQALPGIDHRAGATAAADDDAAAGWHPGADRQRQRDRRTGTAVSSRVETARRAATPVWARVALALLALAGLAALAVLRPSLPALPWQPLQPTSEELVRQTIVFVVWLLLLAICARFAWLALKPPRRLETTRRAPPSWLPEHRRARPVSQRPDARELLQLFSRPETAAPPRPPRAAPDVPGQRNAGWRR